MTTVKDFIHTPMWSHSSKNDQSRCQFSVHETGRGVGFYQCQKGIKETIEGVGFCAVHAKEVKQGLGIKAEITKIRFAARFEYSKPTLLKLSVVSETDSMIDIQEIEEVIGDSMMGFMTGNQRKNNSYTRKFRLYDDKNDAIGYLISQAADHTIRCERELEEAGKTYNQLTDLWYAK